MRGMDALERPKPKHGNPFSRDPVYSANTGRLHRIEVRNLIDSQLQTLAICYEYLASNPYIAALTGCGLEMARNRTRVLKRPPNDYIAIKDIRREEYVTGNIGFFQYFTTTERGEQTLINRQYCDVCRGIHQQEETGHIPSLPLRFPRSTSLAHDVFSHNGVMSLEIGLKNHPGVSLVRGAEVYDHLPEETKKLKYWWNFPLVARQPKSHVEPDYFPLGIDRSPDEEPLFLAFEFERDTHSKTREIYKILDWLDVLKHRTYRKHMGLPNLYPTFITRDITTKEKLKRLIGEHVPSRFQPFFLLKAEPVEQPEMPNGWMLEDSFETTHGTFSILTSKHVVQ
jgi:hypothetical protein